MRSSRLALAAAVGFTLAMALTAPTFAAPAATSAPKSSSTSTPVDASAGGAIDLQIWPGQGGKTAIITVVEVDAKTKLPVTVRIPVTPGSTVEWVGEILGGPAESDIERPYKLVQGQGGQFAEVELTKSRRGQVDAIGFPLKVSSDQVSVSLDYVQSVSSPLTAMSVRLPANISKVKIKPKPVGEPVDNADGESLYTLEPKAYKPGEKETVTISYSTIPPVEPAPGSDLNLVLIGLGVALVIAVVVTIVLFRRQLRVAPAPEELDDASDSEHPLSTASDDDRAFDDDESSPDVD
jgi:hypothetical protein